LFQEGILRRLALSREHSHPFIARALRARTRTGAFCWWTKYFDFFFGQVWIQWWPELEKEVRLAIKPEMKAVYDSRCSDLFSSSKQGLQQLFGKVSSPPPLLRGCVNAKSFDGALTTPLSLAYRSSQAPRSPSTGTERKLTIESIEKCAPVGTWALMASQCDSATLAAIGDGQPVSWESFWPQVTLQGNAS
jgi:hypothetical protein